MKDTTLTTEIGAGDLVYYDPVTDTVKPVRTAMSTYNNYKELEGKVLKSGDKVYLKGIGYSVTWSHLSNSGGSNRKVFDLLGLNVSDFCDKAYGYDNEGGDWPSAKRNDYEALTRCVLALYKVIEEKEKKHLHVKFDSDIMTIHHLNAIAAPGMVEITTADTISCDDPLTPEVVLKHLLSTKQKIMRQDLTPEQKETLSKEDQALLEAGFITNDLAPTPAGIAAVNRHLFKVNKKEAVRLAKQVIADAEKESDCDCE